MTKAYDIITKEWLESVFINQKAHFYISDGHLLIIDGKAFDTDNPDDTEELKRYHAELLKNGTIEAPKST